MTAQEYYDAYFHEHVNEIDFAEGYALHALKDMVERLSERRKQVDGLKDRIKELEAKIASYESAIDGLKKVVDSLYNLKS
jgi:peptidoglycan hydrolase CwlO-like protein